MNVKKKEQLLKDLGKIGFSFLEGHSNKLIYKAIYNNKEVNTFIVDFSSKTKGNIDWGIIENNVRNRRSSNLANKEYLGQLYWVIKLVESGYPPEKIVIEEKVQLGRKEGFIDILILDENDEPFMILDAKTDGKEFDKELRLLKKAKGQVVSYYSYNSKVKYIGIVSAEFLDTFINDESYIVSTEKWNTYGSVAAFSKTLGTNETLKNSFRISTTVHPYDTDSVDLYPTDLIELTEASSSKMFHKFLTILRKYGISDKTNAFNRVLNLFIAKIVDEFNTPDNRKLKFQVLKDETNEQLVAKLEALYSKGMRDFIQVNIDSDKELLMIRDFIENNISNIQDKDKLLRLIEHTQSKASSNFQFKDVYDDLTFEENANLLKELVLLISPYKLKYPKKQQFLGDFFEMILSNGFKQEAGQFFTPVPIARFMVDSLPIAKILNDKVKLGNPNNLLPKMIDFASGSGHFLTEYMDEVQRMINTTDFQNISQSTIRKIESYKVSPFDWAESYVYGIDIDYRLVKTSKVSTFLNGDGNAVIRRANGLDSFSSHDFVGDLYQNSNEKTNGNFDILLANPPYHVAEFRQQLPNFEHDFTLSKYITDNSSEIEAIFIERASQLLSTGGVMGIILPSSILDTSTKIYIEARKLLLRDFEIKAIVKNPKSTFMATGTETVIVFGVKRSRKYVDSLKNILNNPIETLPSKTINGNPNFLKNYVKELYNCSLDDYFEMLNETYKGKNTQLDEYYATFKKYEKKFNSFKDFSLEVEKEKMLYYALTDNEIIVVRTPDKNNKNDELLLGYKFSGRRGHEGIQPRVKNYSIEELSLLYGKNGTYISDVIRGIFLNEEVSPEEIVEPFYTKLKLNRNIHFNSNDETFKIRLSYEGRQVIGYEGGETLPLRNLVNFANGTSITQSQIEIGEIPVIAGGRSPAYFANEYNREGNIITVSQSGAYAGYISYHETPIFASDCFTIKAKENSPYTTKEIYLLLKQKQHEIYKFASGSIQKHVYSTDLESFRIPVPSKKEELEVFISEISNKANKITDIELKIIESKNILRNYINEFVEESMNKNVTLGSLHEQGIVSIGGGKRIPKELDYSPSRTKHYYPGVGDFEEESINLKTSKFIDHYTFEKIKKYE
ncbi:hypothetical protein FHL66_11570, partial [Staphylococcus pseudintermedius]|nr:hypothetical protein [Staphylococcus pseudintermedius]